MQKWQSQLLTAILQKISAGGIMVDPSIHLTFPGVKNCGVTMSPVTEHLDDDGSDAYIRGIRGVGSQFFCLWTFKPLFTERQK